MPKTCIHLERVKALLDKWQIGFKEFCGNGPNGRNTYILESQLGEWTLVVRDDSDFEQLFMHLHSIKYDLLRVINECNCEGENNQQLILARNTETSLIRFQERNEGLERENSRLGDLIRVGERALNKKDEQIEQVNKQLVKVQGDRDDYKNKWVLSENAVKEITNSFNSLQIENNRNKDKIKELKNELGQSKEEYLNQKIELKEEKLEILAQQLGINQGQIDNLRNAYKQLIEARRNFNQANINAADGNINNIKTALSNAGVNPTNKKKVCHKCKKITELEIELNEVYQQQYEARQEVPPRNN